MTVPDYEATGEVRVRKTVKLKVVPWPHSSKPKSPVAQLTAPMRKPQ